MATSVLILDNIRSVENAASIFRTADCLGASKIYLVGTTPAPLDRFGRPRRDFAKVSLGAELSVEWEYAKEIGPVIEELKEQGFSIIALEQDERSVHLTPGPSPHAEERGAMRALILGNEVDGVSKEALDQADMIADLPMKGRKESLNVSVAAGIALFLLS